MTPLRQRMIEDMKLRNFAPRTIQVYVERVATFAKHFGKSPDRLGAADVRAYLLFLVKREARLLELLQPGPLPPCGSSTASPSARSGSSTASSVPKQQKKLPVVLSPAEVTQFFEAIPSLKHRAILMTAYAAGLRVSEVVALRVDDIDSRRMVIRVRQAKGRKDRYVMLSPRLLEILRQYWKAARPTPYLFPGQDPDEAAQSPHGATGLPGRSPGRGTGQARHRPHPASQLRHPPAGGRDQHPDDPDPARASQPQDHGGLHPCLGGGPGGDAKPARPARAPDGGTTTAMTRPRLEVADVFRDHGDAFLDRYGDVLSPEQRRALSDIAACRTAALGGHVEECDQCGHRQIAYNSCRNRHCPKCQATAAAQWMEARGKRNCCRSNTITSSLRSRRCSVPIALQNPREVYGLLFRAAAETLQQIAADPKHLGAEIGFLAVLHTWGQNLEHHPHVHCVVPGGGLSPDGSRWIACPAGVLPPGARAQPRLPGQIPRAAAATPSSRESSPSTGSSASWRTPAQFRRRLAASAETEWVVYAKPPFGGPEQVLKYLARYTHRVAISNRRLVALEDGEVTFHWKDYAHGGGQKTMTLKATEFIRRFLLHVLPSGFVRIRHYGFLANRVCQEKLALCRALLGVETTPEPVAADPSGRAEGGRRRTASREGLSLLRRGSDGDHRDVPSDAGRPEEMGVDP